MRNDGTEQNHDTLHNKFKSSFFMLNVVERKFVFNILYHQKSKHKAVFFVNFIGW